MTVAALALAVGFSLAAGPELAAATPASSGPSASTAPTGPSAPTAPSSPFGATLSKPPLKPPLVVTGGFGEYRRGHFHAGFDLGTGRRVGSPVSAPENGWVERVRCSGVGYGRSVYIRARDGRTFQMGHLDAFAKPIDDYVRQAQEATGQYEQDLWPSDDEIRVRAGDVVAWSGQSGAGGPHLHFEIRRGDVAYHPQRAGLVVPDRRPPSIPRVTLEPLDDSSAVQGGMGPVTISLGKADTVRAIGRLRAIVDARDGAWRGVDRMVPWSVGITWRGRTTECRFDSVSWATDMPEGDYVHDAGRVTGGKGLVLWAPARYRPRFLRSDAPLSEEAGTLDVQPGDPPHALEIWARDVAGGTVRRTVVLRPGAAPAPAEPGRWKCDAPATDLPGEFVSLPGGSLRWSLPVSLAPVGGTLQIGSIARRATRVGSRWCATFRNPGAGSGRVGRIVFAARFEVPQAAARETCGIVAGASLAPADSLVLTDEGRRLVVPSGALFEHGFVFTVRGSVTARARGLAPLGGSWCVEPSRMPLRRPARLTFPLPSGQPLEGIGLYRLDSDGWTWLGGERDGARRTLSAESRQLGTFALFRDVTPPRATLHRAPRPTAVKPYSRWALEASVVEQGSGLDARGSWLEVDGTRVPTEWDPEAGRLRWRPVRPPRSGLHKVVVVAEDRAGNTARTEGSFRMGK